MGIFIRCKSELSCFCITGPTSVFASIRLGLLIRMMMTTSGHGTGGSSSPDSADFGRAGTPELGDELSELAPILDSVHMTPHKVSLL